MYTVENEQEAKQDVNKKLNLTISQWGIQIKVSIWLLFN